ncbi:MAG: sulfatase [Halobacteriales archaeon]
MRTGSTSLAGTILITVDSLRADAVFGSSAREIAPTLSSLAERGAAFTDAVAPGNWTPFSFPGILASRTVFAGGDDVGLPDSPALAETLSSAGIETAGFNAANGFLTSHWGYDRGFDRFESFIDDPGSGIYGTYITPHPTVQGWLQLGTAPFRRLSDRLRRREADRIVDTSHTLDVERAATEFVASAGEPFFIWIHYMDPHTPYVPAGKHRRAIGSDAGIARMLTAQIRAGLGKRVPDRALEALRALYHGSVNQTDDSIRRVLDALADRAIRDETCVIVAGDHGEAFGEHGHLAHYPTLHEEVTAVPLIIDYPEATPQTVTAPTSLDVIPPTICRIMGVEPPSAFQGRSVLPAATGETPRRVPVTSVALQGETVAEQPIPRRLGDGDLIVRARTEEWAYEAEPESGRETLYERTGSGEQEAEIDAATEATLTELREAAAERLGRIGSDETNGRAPTPESVDRQLAALGYR